MTRTLRVFLVMLALAGGLPLAACNTMEGLGQDIERGGEKLEGAADQNK